MKAISYYQPYAWMLANGYLDIDDRTWPTSHRGEIMIHASKKLDQHYYDYVKYQLNIDIPAPEHLEYGGIVAKANLVDIIKPGAPTSVPSERRAHGGSHCYGWLFNQVEKLSFIPYRGMPGLFDIDLEDAINNSAAINKKQTELDHNKPNKNRNQMDLF